MISEEFFRAESGLIRIASAGGLSGTCYLEDSSQSNDPHGAWWQSFLQGKRPRSAATRRPVLRLLDLCCGCGGLTLGFREAAEAVGLRVSLECAVDVDPGSLAVYSANFAPRLALLKSISSLVDVAVLGRGDEAVLAYEPTLLDPCLTKLAGQTHVLVAGPPCQGHSNFNNRTRRADPRNTLYLSVVGIALALRVPALIIENVPEVTRAEKEVVRTAVRVLSEAGYHTSEMTLNAADFGFAQSRKRHFLLATPSAVPSRARVKSSLGQAARPLSWAIGDLLDCPQGHWLDSVSQSSDENKRRIQYLFDHDLYDLPREIRPDCHKEGHTYPSVYGRMKWDQPAQTITTGFNSPGRGRFVHPLRQRVLTPHEAARVQGFPDWYTFETTEQPLPSRTALAKWIGEAVPSGLGYIVGLAALAGLGRLT